MKKLAVSRNKLKQIYILKKKKGVQYVQIYLKRKNKKKVIT